MKRYIATIFCLLSWLGQLELQARIPTDPRKRKTSYPFLSGDTFRAFCDHIFDETRIPFDPDKVNEGDTIFVNADILQCFFKQLHPQIKARYILVTHNSIYEMPGHYEQHIHDPQLFAWFGKNMTMDHPKLFPIPLGIANSHWPHGNTGLLRNIMDHLSSQKRTEKLVYINMSIHTNRAERVHALQYVGNRPFSFHASRKSFDRYLKEMAQFVFTISPEGTSIDCHRTWEALYVGTIPIVKHSGIDKLFDDLPVLLINDWSEVTYDFLKAKYNEMQHQEYKQEKLFADYWLDQIRAVQVCCRSGGLL